MEALSAIKFPKNGSVRRKGLFYALIGIIIVTGLAGTAMITQTNQTTSVNRSQEQDALRETSEIKPNQIEIRTGIPTLTSFETPYSDSIDYYQIKQGQYSYLDRSIQKGTTLISDTEMNQYFETFSDKAYRFAVASSDGTTGYYTINYFEPPISLDRHNILISIKENVSASAKALPTENAAYLSEAIDRPFRWVEVDGIAALALNKLAAEDGNTFNVITNEGEKTVRLMYVGPYSEELKLPEFQTMYGLASTSSIGGQ